MPDIHITGQPIRFLIQHTDGDSARHTVIRRFPRAKEFDWLPAAPFVYNEIKGGCIIAGMRDNRLVKQVISSEHLDEQAARLIPGAYLIHLFRRGNADALLVIGGDLAGYHYALSDLARDLALTPDGIVYRGGAKCEIPAFAYRAYWDTDTRTRWNTDTDFPIRHTCLLDYPDDAATYIDNMQRVIDGMLDYRRNVLVIWGFVRDEHGGVEASQAICRYAAARGIDVTPGIGTHFYGGPYYRGNHPFNLDTYMRTHPAHTKIDTYGIYRPCPTDPHNVAWLRDGVQWLFETFDIKGVNLENGDYFACRCETCRQALATLNSRNPEFIQAQYLSYYPVLDELRSIPKSRWNTYATYTGFAPLYQRELDPLDPGYDDDPQKRQELLARYRFIDDKTLKHQLELGEAFPEAIAQWNIDGQLRRYIPLKAFLDDGKPAIIYQGPLWPRGLKSPVPRNTFYSTASQFGGMFLSITKELAVRTQDGDDDGVIDYGEISPRNVSTEITYLAQSFFSYHPDATLREFAHTELAHRIGGEELADVYIELLCRKDDGTLTGEDRGRIWQRVKEFEDAMIHLNACPDHPSEYSTDRFRNYYPYKYWRWLAE